MGAEAGDGTGLTPNPPRSDVIGQNKPTLWNGTIYSTAAVLPTLNHVPITPSGPANPP